MKKNFGIIIFFLATAIIGLASDKDDVNKDRFSHDKDDYNCVSSPIPEPSTYGSIIVVSALAITVLIKNKKSNS